VTHGDSLFGQGELSSIPLGHVAGTYETFSFGSVMATAAHLRTEIGRTWAKGTASNTAKARSPCDWTTQLGPAIDVAVEAPLGRHFGVELHVQSGLARGIATEADTRAVAGNQGFFLRIPDRCAVPVVLLDSTASR